MMNSATLRSIWSLVVELQSDQQRDHLASLPSDAIPPYLMHRLDREFYFTPEERTDVEAYLNEKQALIEDILQDDEMNPALSDELLPV